MRAATLGLLTVEVSAKITNGGVESRRRNRLCMPAEESKVSRPDQSIRSRSEWEFSSWRSVEELALFAFIEWSSRGKCRVLFTSGRVAEEGDRTISLDS